MSRWCRCSRASVNSLAITLAGVRRCEERGRDLRRFPITIVRRSSRKRGPRQHARPKMPTRAAGKTHPHASHWSIPAPSRPRAVAGIATMTSRESLTVGTIITRDDPPVSSAVDRPRRTATANTCCSRSEGGCMNGASTNSHNHTHARTAAVRSRTRAAALTRGRNREKTAP